MKPTPSNPPAAGEAAHTPTFLPSLTHPWEYSPSDRAIISPVETEESFGQLICTLPDEWKAAQSDEIAAFIVRACNEFDSLITLARNVSDEQNSPYRKQALAILSRI